MKASYQGVVDTLKMAIGLGSDVTDSNVALVEREKVAAAPGGRLLRRGRSPRRPGSARCPAALGQVLRDAGRRQDQPGRHRPRGGDRGGRTALMNAGRRRISRRRASVRARAPPPVGAPPASQP